MSDHAFTASIFYRLCCVYDWVMALRRAFTILLISFPFLSFSQEMDNGASYKSMDFDRYIRFSYDNDFFTATDEYYTQGINIEVVSPNLKYNPLSKVMVHLRSADNKYGLAVVHEGYTPRSIGDEQILYNNHPYAAVLVLKIFSISNKAETGQRLYTALTAGVIGSVALGEQMQVAIHTALGNLLPGGWKNQIHNDLVFNYEASYEYKLFNAGHMFELDVNAAARAGTFNDRASLGLSLTTGYFNSPLSDNKDGKTFHIYLYEAPIVSAVAYDATLQGGMFNRTSPYTITDAQMNRIVFENKAGIVLTWKSVYLEYYQAYVSKTFSTGLTHQWGGLSFGVRL